MSNIKKGSPRKVPSREEKYMGLTHWIAAFSKDPNTQVGALIIDSKGKPKGWGYNGPPSEILDSEVNWDRPYKYSYIIHAEMNAIMHSSGSLSDSTLYVSAKPCKTCMLQIITSGIKKVIYFPFKGDEKSMLSNKDDEVDEIARLGKVSLVKYSGNLNWMRDRIGFMEEIGVFSFE